MPGRSASQRRSPARWRGSSAAPRAPTPSGSPTTPSPSRTNKNSREQPMKLTIFAATGGIGQQALEQALAAGHDVTAVVRNPNKLAGEAVRIVTADLAAADPAALESAVAGADAVLSGLGPRSTSETGIASQGTRAIVQAMQATGARRIVVVSAAPIATIPSSGRPKPPGTTRATGSSCGTCSVTLPKPRSAHTTPTSR